jgi:hypothetical protein
MGASAHGITLIVVSCSWQKKQNATTVQLAVPGHGAVASEKIGNKKNLSSQLCIQD